MRGCHSVKSSARKIVLVFGAFLFLSCFPDTEEAPKENDKFTPPYPPNVLLISLDTTRADHLSAYGYPRRTSPHIEELAARGHRFDSAFTTIPSTLPSHASMLTSLYPSSLGVRGNGQRIPQEANTLAERLIDRGYRTAAFVSEIPLDASTGIDQGFQTFNGPGDFAVREVIRWIHDEQSTDLIERNGNQDGEGELASQPFFAFVHLFDPHARYNVHADAPKDLWVPHGAYPGERGVLDNPDRFTPEHIERTIKAYDAEIHHADRRIGELLEALESFGIAERTLVIFVSDHGETLDELLDEIPYGFDHGEFLHTRELRVPLIVALPAKFGDVMPAIHRSPVSTIDLMPTILEIIGTECDAPCEGRSLVPLLFGQNLPSRAVFSERRWISPDLPPMGTRTMSVAEGRWRYQYSDEYGVALFDLSRDPEESIDVGSDHPRVKARMHSSLQRWANAHAKPLWNPPGNKLDPETRRSLEELGYVMGP